MKKFFVLSISLLLVFTLTACGNNTSNILENRSKTNCSYLFRVKQDSNYGFVNEKGQIVVPIEYYEATNFNEGFASIKDDKGWHIVDINGNLISVPYDGVNTTFVGGVAQVWNGDLKERVYGFMDTSGELVVPFDDYGDKIMEFSEGIASVYMNFDKGDYYINKHGERINSYTYDDAYSFSEGLAKVKKDEKYGFIDAEGNIAVPLIYDDALGFSEGYAAVRQNRKYGFIDKNGNIVIPIIYDKISSFKEGLAKVEKDGKQSYINTNGEEALLITDNYTYFGLFSEGLAMVEKDGKCGFINTKGENVIPIIYEEASDFQEGFASVKKDGKYGAIDSENNVVVPFEYDFVGDFNEGFASVEKDGKCGAVNTKGDIVISITYDIVNGKYKPLYSY